VITPAVVSCLHPAFRLPAMDALFPPMTIDYETRPYEMGWILHAWLAGSELQPLKQSAPPHTDLPTNPSDQT
jgi:hypothetical protein